MKGFRNLLECKALVSCKMIAFKTHRHSLSFWNARHHTDFTFSNQKILKPEKSMYTVL